MARLTLTLDTESNLVWFAGACASFKSKEDLWRLINNPHIIKAADAECRARPLPASAPRETIEEALARGVIIQRIAPQRSHAQRKAEERERLASLSVDELLSELDFEFELLAEGQTDTTAVIQPNEEAAA